MSTSATIGKRLNTLTRHNRLMSDRLEYKKCCYNCYDDIENHLAMYNFDIRLDALNQIMANHPDAFSKCQLMSKLYMVDEISKLDLKMKEEILVIGSWVGILPYVMIKYNSKKYIPTATTFYLVDIDYEAMLISRNLLHNYKKDGYDISGYNMDINSFSMNLSYKPENITTVVNPIGEHLRGDAKWTTYKNANYVVSNTDYTKPDDHINTVNDSQQMLNYCTRNNIKVDRLFELQLPMYTRFIATGKHVDHD